LPTKPANPGSWPEPPPDIIETFAEPASFVGLLYMILLGASKAREGFVIVRECSAVLTRCVGSSMKCFVCMSDGLLHSAVDQLLKYMVMYTVSGESESFKTDNQKGKTSYLPSISSTFSCTSSLYSNCGEIMQVGGGEPGSVHSHANTNQPTPTHGLEAWPLLEVIEWPSRAKCM
jgi:hypothetical protein